jgi:hypothetical protein
MSQQKKLHLVVLGYDSHYSKTGMPPVLLRVFYAFLTTPKLLITSRKTLLGQGFSVLKRSIGSRLNKTSSQL